MPSVLISTVPDPVSRLAHLLQKVDLLAQVPQRDRDQREHYEPVNDPQPARAPTPCRRVLHWLIVRAGVSAGVVERLVGLLHYRPNDSTMRITSACTCSTLRSASTTR